MGLLNGNTPFPFLFPQLLWCRGRAWIVRIRRIEHLPDAARSLRDLRIARTRLCTTGLRIGTGLLWITAARDGVRFAAPVFLLLLGEQVIDLLGAHFPEPVFDQ